MWIDTQTGEVLPGESCDDPQEGAIWIEPEDVPDEPTGQAFDEWVPNWLAKQFLHVDAEEAAVNEQHKRLVATIKARRRYLEFAYMRRAEAIVKADLEVAGGKRKSVDYDFGRCGWRTSRRLEVVDQELALAWARKHCQDAVKTTVSLLKGSLPKGEHVPGVIRRTDSTFYVRPAVPSGKGTS